MKVADMRMCKQTSEVTREDKIKKEQVRGRIGIVSIMDKIKENRHII